MSTKRVLFIVFASNLLLLAGLFGMLYVARSAYALPPTQPPAVQMAATGAWDPNLYPQVPDKMMYQGVLRDSSGNPLNGTYNLTFVLQQCDPFCGDVWSEVHNNVPITNGLFTVVLGETNYITPSLFTGYTGWNWISGEEYGSVLLVVKVNGQELTPSSEMLSVPYAFRAEYVNRFPKPDWDSGWVTVTAGSNFFTHSLGGNTDDYIVDMQFKDTTSSNGVHQVGYGFYSRWNDTGSYNELHGAYWYGLTNSNISVYLGGHETIIGKARIRIWRTE